MSVDTHSSRQGRPYSRLHVLIVVMTVVALGIGALALHYLETRLVSATGENLALAAAEITDKLDRLLFERYGDTLMMARAFPSRVHDPVYLNEYLNWVKTAYAPVYLWLGVTDAQGRIVTATDSALVGLDYGQSVWFQRVRDGSKVHVGDVGPYEVVNGMEAVAFTAPILGAQGEFLGVITTRLGIPMLEAVLTRTIREMESREGFSGHIEYQILTQNGDVFIDADLLHKGRVNLKRIGLPSAVRSLLGEPGYVEEEHLRRHVFVVTGYAQTKGYGEFQGLRWSVLFRQDRDDILRPIHGTLWKVGLAGAVVWLPMLGLLFWATSRLQGQYRQAQQESACARAAEAALLQTRERHRVIVDTALDGVVTMDARGFITEWNVQAAKIFGWTREEALGRKLSETIVLPHDEKTSARVFQRFVETREGPTLNQRIEVMASHRDGHEFPIELSVSPARLGAEPVLNAFVRDITIRKRAERRLASQYAVTRVLVEAADLQEAGPRILQTICETLEWELGAFWCVDKQADVLRCLDIWRAPTLEADDFIAATRERSFSMGTGLPGRIWGNGKPVWVSDVVVDQNFPRASVAAKVGLHGAFGFPILVGGDVVGVIELFSRQVREPDQDLLRMVADIGLKIGQFRERTRAEEALHHTEARLRQSQKMEAVGRLAGGVAHDFNNLLTVIRGYSELILNRLSQADPMRKEMEEVKKASDRAAGLTSQLLAFSRRQYITPKIVDLNAVVSNVDGMLRRLVGEDIIELCAVLDPDLGRIKADPGQIEQVIMNLAVNARDAMPGGGRLTIETRNVTVTERIGALPSIVEPGSYVMLMVKDTGCGMEEDTQSHLFEPFFTTKEKGKGTGLGLSTVYGIVRQNSGSISVESALGQGTTFKMYFPQVGDPATEADSAALTLDRIRGHETVLLVEDEPGVRGLVHETLRLQGYAVLEARHGIEALLTGAKHMGPIHLLLTDVVMPQMSGPEVAEKLSSVRPDLKVLYMSGYPDHPVFSRDGIKTDRAFLQKPFTTYTLIQKVREVLDTVGK